MQAVIIRRLKKDVEKSLPPKVEQILRVDMTKRQKTMYKNVLTKNYDFLSKGGKNQVSLINIMMQLRKTSNHLELIHEPDYEAQKTSEERYKDLIYGSGKMVLLDKLLTRFREKGDRVLIFSQMVIILYPVNNTISGCIGDHAQHHRGVSPAQAVPVSET